MFKNLLKFAFLFMMAAAILTTGCTPDDPLPDPDPVNTPPTVEFLASGFTDTIFTTDTSALFGIDVKADTGSTTLYSFTIYNEGVKMTTANFRVGGVAPASNPILIVDATDKNGFTWDLGIRSQNTFDTQTFTVEIADDNGLTAEASIVIQVTEPITTDLTMNSSGHVFYNNGGASKGGISLLTGDAQSAANSNIEDEPHIYDRGPAVGWENKISPATAAMSPNYTTVLKSTTGVDYDATSFSADIQDIFDNGTEIIQDDKSETITVGTVFVAKVTNAGTDTYVLFRFDTINDLGSANDDNYEISIKY